MEVFGKSASELFCGFYFSSNPSMKRKCSSSILLITKHIKKPPTGFSPASKIIFSCVTKVAVQEFSLVHFCTANRGTKNY
jgi:hypothetical protein